MWSPSRVAKERIAKRRSRVGAKIGQWPLVGTSVALLLIIMASQGMVSQVHPMVVADLPFTAHAAPRPMAVRENAIKITLTRDGMIYFRNQKTTPQELTGLIHIAVEKGTERRVYLASDARAKYGDVKAVVDLIGQAGISDITLLAEKTSPR